MGSSDNRCASCKFWEKQQDSEYSTDMGDCSYLSGVVIPKGREILGDLYDKEEYPDTEKTGIEGWPICGHDGKAFTYETKSWFGCIHYSAQ